MGILETTLILSNYQYLLLNLIEQRFKMAEWNNGIMSCMDDCGLCLITCIFAPFTVGKNAEAAGVTSCIMGGLAMLVPLLNLYCLVKIRGAVAEKYGIEEGVFGSIMMTLCCPLCSIIQVAAQLKQAPGEAVA